MYPVQRYVNALTLARLCPFAANLDPDACTEPADVVDNPLFTDFTLPERLANDPTAEPIEARGVDGSPPAPNPGRHFGGAGRVVVIRLTRTGECGETRPAMDAAGARGRGPELFETLELGDVIMSLGAYDFSQEMRKVDGGKYSHATVWTGEACIEAVYPRVREITLQKLGSQSLQMGVYHHRDVDEERRLEIVRHARSFLTRPYDITDLEIAIALGTFTAWASKKNRWVAMEAEAAFKRLRPFLIEVGAWFSARARTAATSGDDEGVDGAEQVTCVELVVLSHLRAQLPILVQLNPGGDVDFETLRPALMSIAKCVEGGGHESAVAATEEQARAWLDGELDWLQREYDAIHSGRLSASDYEGRLQDLETLDLIAGKTLDAALVTPRQLELSRSMQRRGEVLKSELQAHFRQQRAAEQSPAVLTVDAVSSESVPSTR